MRCLSRLLCSSGAYLGSAARQPPARKANPRGRTNGEYDNLAVVPVRECLVSFDDTRGVRHSVTVQASSVLEAAGLALKRVREQEMLDDDEGFGDVIVEIATKTIHKVPIAKLRDWRDGNGKTPVEMSRRANTRGR